MRLHISNAPQTGSIVESGFHRCLATASCATEWIKGKPMEDTLTMQLFSPPVKLQGSTLKEDAIKAAVKGFKSRSLRREDGASTISNFSTHYPMRMPFLLQGGRSLKFSGSDRFFCYQVMAYQATTNSDGSSSPGKLTATAFQGRLSNLWKSSSKAIVSFPWGRIYVRFIERMLDLFGIVAKWLAIPTLVLSSLSEFLYTLSAKKDLYIPLGILTGVLVARIFGNTALEVLDDVQDKKAPWPLLAMGVVFLLLKLPGPYYPALAAAFLPHMANAGLVQTILLYRKWQQKSS